ncbi:MAG: type III secretion inner membrane ring lipoprotein SctJ [Alteromonadaceae bacterium]|nr:type III secretion inner membrane ring lipoprotein SctJ [Alteromonadaceae bacterium]
MFRVRHLFLLTCLFVLTACKVELYSGLDEQEGNEMLALLLSEGIAASKEKGKGETVNLQVEESDLSAAMTLLSRHSYPRHQYATLDDVFPQGGLIQSPMADSARYSFAKSQGLAATLATIDGVLTAKVHLVLPEKDSGNKLSQPSAVKPAKASVFIKYNRNVDLEAYIPQIKTMVANAVEDLEYANVAVVIFPSIPNNTHL